MIGEKKTTSVGTRFTEATTKQLRQLALKERRPISVMVRLIVEDFFDKTKKGEKK